MASRREKMGEIWDSGVVVDHIRETLDFLVRTVIWGSFVALVSKWPPTRKWLAVC